MSISFERDVVIVGGCGHVGLPLGIALAGAGRSVSLYDVNEAAVHAVNSGCLPFDEPGAKPVLDSVLASVRLSAGSDPAVIAAAETVVVVIGTPVGAHLSPEPEGITRAIQGLAEHLRNGQLMILRSTIYPGVTAHVEKLLRRLHLDIDVAACPERIAEGRAMTELYSLPQIIGAHHDRAAERAAALFRSLTDQIILLQPEEAELAKLFTNVWRYVKFATANQFYMIANDYGLDFERIRSALTAEYPRAADMPGAGFAAGPCLFKDTMQLAAYNNNQFILGHASMMINEGLPLYVVSRLERRFELASMTVGILGMAFKPESDDIRSSLSYKLKRILKFKAGEVLCTDPFVRGDPDMHPLDTVLERSDLLVIATPHLQYADLKPSVPVVDVTSLLGNGAIV